MYRHLRRKGVPVILFVLNEEEEFEEALSYCPEVDGMMTDAPSKLKQFALGRMKREWINEDNNILIYLPIKF